MSDKKPATENGNPKPKDGVKKTRHRSPNYPYFGLKKAVERVKQVYDKYKRAVVPINLVQELWEYKAHSGAGNQAVAAVKTYGLIEVEGEGEDRKVRITDPGYRILAGSPDRSELLKKSAVLPAIHNELWEKYRAEEHFPDDSLIRHYLRWERTAGTFNEETVDSFIENFRSSLRYSGLLPGGDLDAKVGTAPDGPEGREKPEVSKGDVVQWTSNGSDQFDEPREVLALSDDGKFAFVPGTDTGLPVDQLTVVGRAMTTTDTRGQALPKAGSPPANPFFKPIDPDEPPVKSGASEEKMTLDEGPVLIRWPNSLSADSFHEFEYFLQGLINRARRKAGIPVKDKKHDKGADNK